MWGQHPSSACRAPGGVAYRAGIDTLTTAGKGVWHLQQQGDRDDGGDLRYLVARSP